MSKRLQVILKDAEYREAQRMARARNLSLSEWVRQMLTMARQREPAHAASKKLAFLRAATSHEFPTANIERMLGEIESGYDVTKIR
jgi:hypothetical protein